MSQYDEDRRDDPVISISVDEGRVVLRPHGVLDDEAVDTLIRLLAGARAAGAIAVVDFQHVERRDDHAAV